MGHKLDHYKYPKFGKNTKRNTFSHRKKKP